MSIGPLRRLVGVVGLVALVPIMAMVARGELGLVDAAARASITLVVLLVLGRLVSWGVGAMASQVEASGDRGRQERRGGGEGTAS